MKKKISKNSKVKKKNPENSGTFCTECGEELEDFAFSEKVKNKTGLKKNHYNCVKTGKFSGEFCSKLFISDDTLLGDIWFNKE